jgi:myosin protein heavy chain
MNYNFNLIFVFNEKQSELEDTTVELESQRTKVLDLEKKQRNFDKVLMEEKTISERYAIERDNAERDAREKETKVNSVISNFALKNI